MEHTLVEMDYDIKKCPLGKLKKGHIEKVSEKEKKEV
jgi:hypothetical protein